MLTECSNKDLFFIVILTEEISINYIHIINKELYSSTIKNFIVLGSLIYPTEDW